MLQSLPKLIPPEFFFSVGNVCVENGKSTCPCNAPSLYATHIEKLRSYQVLVWGFSCSFLTAWFLYRAGDETPALSGGYPNWQFWYPLLRFGSQHRIPKHLFFLVFWVYREKKTFGYFPEVPVTKTRASAPAP